MGYDMGAFLGTGDTSVSSNEYGAAAPTAKVTDLSPHVDGGTDSTRGTNIVASGNSPLHDAAMLVAAALILLWVLGGFAFRSHNL